MDAKVIGMCDYYSRHAQIYYEQTKSTDMSSLYEHFISRIKLGSRILDLGAGSGRDALWFWQHGYDAEALEPSIPLCNLWKSRFGGRIINQKIENFQPTQPYDAIWACASLLHLTQSELMEFVHRLPAFLKPGGILYASGKNQIETGYQADGRYFLEFTEELVKEIVVAVPGIELLELWYTSDARGRRETRWLNFILRYAGPNEFSR